MRGSFGLFTKLKMSVDVVFLGTGSGYPTPHRGASGIAFRMDGDVWLVDCGEGTQTQIMKYKSIRPGKISKIFVTHLHGDHIFGLPGLLCTISMAFKPPENAIKVKQNVANGKRDVVEIYGPAGLRRFLRETLSLSRSVLMFDYVVHEIIPQKIQFGSIKEGDPDWDKWSPDHQATGKCHINERNHGRAIFYDSILKHWHIYKDKKITVTAGQLDHRIPAFGYVFSEASKPGKLKVDELLKAGLSKGPLFGKIKSGEDVVLENGETLKAQDFIGPKQCGRKWAVLQDTRNSWNMLDLCHKCDVMIHEATNEEQHREKCFENGHSTAIMAAEFARSAECTHLILTHLSQRYKDPNIHENIEEDDLLSDVLLKEAQSVFDGPVLVAYDGLLYPINAIKSF